ncbi:hypothetical protein RvY_04464 [Ramazzottius varieornatus]|uniref:Reverse transcriptase domain-containing protein n=1 Tax=Ramazzottius varieornatus TaxID=947166 RepID=A0A1D1V1P6_RAMVA|nr:hypothetical protein RvY_04464 [Ramazzottius varieornatus]
MSLRQSQMGVREKYLVHPKDEAEYIANVFVKDYGACGAHCRPINNQVPFTVTRCKECLPSLNVTGPKVWEVLRKIPDKKAAGSSVLTNALVKPAGIALVYPLTRFFNLFLCTKQCPTPWKKADVVSVPKKGRTQRVTDGGYYSEYSEVRSGVPRGSVLDPLFFIVAVNKLSESVECELYQYADDLVAHQVISKPEVCSAFQESVDQLVKNCPEAGLSLNPSKSQHIRISFKRSGSGPVPHGHYSISGQKIPKESQTTCLGLVLDRKLNWTAQVDAITAKCRKRLHVMRSYFPLQLGEARQLLYQSLVRLVAEYACSVWNPTNHKHQRQLEQVQKDFLKSIRLSKIPKGQHDGDFSQYRQHLAEVKWDHLWTRRAKSVLVNGFEIWTNGFPDGRLLLNVSSPVQQPPTRANTRSQTCARVPEGKVWVQPATRIKEKDTLNVTSDTFAYVASALINDMNFRPSPANCRSLSAFRSYLDRLDFRKFSW